MSALCLREATESVDFTVVDLHVLQLPSVGFDFTAVHSWELQHWVVRRPKTLNEALLEVDDGLDGLEGELLGGLALTSQCVDLHRGLNHHVQVVHTLAQDL